jgi:hypothetical protein
VGALLSQHSAEVPITPCEVHSSTSGLHGQRACVPHADMHMPLPGALAALQHHDDTNTVIQTASNAHTMVVYMCCVWFAAGRRGAADIWAHLVAVVLASCPGGPQDAATAQRPVGT